MEPESVTPDAPAVDAPTPDTQGQPDGGGTADVAEPEFITADKLAQLEDEPDPGDLIPDGDEDEGVEGDDEPGEQAEPTEGDGEGEDVEEADPLDSILSKLSPEERQAVEAVRQANLELAQRQQEIETQQAEQAFRSGEVFALLPQDFAQFAHEKITPSVDRAVDSVMGDLQNRFGQVVLPVLAKLKGGFDQNTGEALEPPTDQEVISVLHNVAQMVFGVEGGGTGMAGVMKDLATRAIADGAMSYRRYAGTSEESAVSAEIAQVENAMAAEGQRLGWGEDDPRYDRVTDETIRLAKGGMGHMAALKKAFATVQEQTAPAAQAAAKEAADKVKAKTMLSMGGTANRAPGGSVTKQQVKGLLNSGPQGLEQIQKLREAGKIKITG